MEEKNEIKRNKIKKNIEILMERVEKAVRRSGRKLEDVKIVAVSKSRQVEDIGIVYDCGIRDFGENYVQEALQKIGRLKKDILWHFIGHLQTNKIKFMPNFEYVHSIDSIEKIKKLNLIAEKTKKIKFLIEVNIGKEKGKAGIMEEEIESFMESMLSLDMRFLEFRGFMIIPPPLRYEYFRKMREIKDRIEKKFNIKIPDLSMGMSDDFEYAILEGATIIRIGRAIFEI